jgi:hypothetical protein
VRFFCYSSSLCHGSLSRNSSQISSSVFLMIGFWATWG